MPFSISIFKPMQDFLSPENPYRDVLIISSCAFIGAVANLAITSAAPLCAIQCGAAEGGAVGTATAWTLHAYTAISKRCLPETSALSTPLELSSL